MDIKELDAIANDKVLSVFDKYNKINIANLELIKSKKEIADYIDNVHPRNGIDKRLNFAIKFLNEKLTPMPKKKEDPKDPKKE